MRKTAATNIVPGLCCASVFVLKISIGRYAFYQSPSLCAARTHQCDIRTYYMRFFCRAKSFGIFRTPTAVMHEFCIRLYTSFFVENVAFIYHTSLTVLFALGASGCCALCPDEAIDHTYS